jgi:2-polyprenyl-3-methyl-5-hydroxy-6-metoxy-1,4-benzoquinol methylase
VTYRYEGSELELFSNAVNWKAYWKSNIAKHITGRVLEVGAGIGANAVLLSDLHFDTWTCLEPDEAQCDKLGFLIRTGRLDNRFDSKMGTLDDIHSSEAYDGILYIDVLEHIASDTSEIASAASLLAPGGSLIILSPAHNFFTQNSTKKLDIFDDTIRDHFWGVCPRE